MATRQRLGMGREYLLDAGSRALADLFSEHRGQQKGGWIPAFLLRCDKGVVIRGRQTAQPAFFFASRSQVSTTVSGLSDNDSIPCSISHSARSG